MFTKVIKGLLLAALVIFYAWNLYAYRDNMFGVIVYNPVNLAVLALILYLASDYVNICGTLCILVIVCGVCFHGYRYYNAYYGGQREGNATVYKCRSNDTNWYKRLNDGCY